MRYLDNSLIVGWVQYALCLSAADYAREAKRLNAENPTNFLIDGKHATTHFFERKEGGSGAVAIVCLGEHDEKDPIAVATLLVHEAVHIWQYECELMGEDAPGEEIEAYAIQRISDNLMRAYIEQTRG